MNNLKLFFALSCIVLSSCVREDAPYDQVYHLYHYRHSDSFKAEASLSRNGGLLEKNESVTFNGQAPTSSVAGADIFYWTGEGMPSANFVLKQRKHQYSNSFSPGTLGICDFTFPDTVYMSQGFTIRLHNYYPENQASLGFNLETPSPQYASIVGDSAVITADMLSGLIGPGVHSITFAEFAAGTPDEMPEGRFGAWYITSQYRKTVVVMP